MKILYLIPRLNNAGPINQLFNLVSNLDQKLYQTYVITIYKEFRDSRKKDFIDAGVYVDSLELGNKYLNINAKKKLVNVINRINPDIIHTATLPADRMMYHLKISIPWCLTIHCNIYTDYLGRFGVILGKLFIIKHVSCFKNVSVPICCSKTLMRIYSEHGISTRYIQNGTEIKVYYPADERMKNVIKKKLGFDCDEKIILVVGSLDKRKRSLFVIEALKENIKNRKMKLVFCGTGVEQRKCENAARDCNEIVFMGQVDNIIEYFQAADYYISASSSEGLPMSVIEAGCTGLPLLLSDISQHKELAENMNNLSGISFFRLDNLEDLKCKFEKMLETDTNTQLIANYFRNYFSAQVMGCKYEKIYNEILNEKGTL